MGLNIRYIIWVTISMIWKLSTLMSKSKLWLLFMMYRDFATISCFEIPLSLDCNPMTYILSCQLLGVKYSKWIIILQEFDFELIKSKSKKSLVFIELICNPSLNWYRFNNETINSGWFFVPDFIIRPVVWRYIDLSPDLNILARNLSLATSTYSLPGQRLSDHSWHPLPSWYRYNFTKVPYSWRSWESFEWFPFWCLWWTFIQLCYRIEVSLC